MLELLHRRFSCAVRTVLPPPRSFMQRMCEQCNVQTAVLGVPKSVDNDLLMVGLSGGDTTPF